MATEVQQHPYGAYATIMGAFAGGLALAGVLARALDRDPQEHTALDLVVFAGHEEYVTGHVYALVRRFRNLGGNLAFLLADNFYWRVVRRGDAIVRTASWRELSRPRRRSSARSTPATTRRGCGPTSCGVRAPLPGSSAGRA